MGGEGGGKRWSRPWRHVGGRREAGLKGGSWVCGRSQGWSKVSAPRDWHAGVAITEFGSLWGKQAFGGKSRYSVRKVKRER